MAREARAALVMNCRREISIPVLRSVGSRKRASITNEQNAIPDATLHEHRSCVKLFPISEQIDYREEKQLEPAQWRHFLLPQSQTICSQQSGCRSQRGARCTVHATAKHRGCT